MDPVDVLTAAVQAAQLIRSGKDPEKILVGAYRALRIRRPDDGEDHLAVRIARLTEADGLQRSMYFRQIRFGDPAQDDVLLHGRADRTVGEATGDICQRAQLVSSDIPHGQGNGGSRISLLLLVPDIRLVPALKGLRARRSTPILGEGRSRTKRLFVQFMNLR